MKRNSIVAMALLCAVFLAAGYNAQTQRSETPTPASERATESSKIGSGMKRVQLIILTPGKAFFAPGRTVTRPENSLAATPYQLSEDAAALVAEMCDLQLVAHGTDLVLDSGQWSVFAGVVLRAQAVDKRMKLGLRRRR